MNPGEPSSDTADTTRPRMGLLSVEDARRRVVELVQPLTETENVALREALGRVLAEAVVSPMNVPPYANSAMDGYALRAADVPSSGKRRLRVIGKSFAGAPFNGTVRAGECVRIMTGAVIPQGADTVVMQEHAESSGDEVHIGAGHKQGQNVRLPGEDLKAGHSVLGTGKRITPADLGLLASLGLPGMRVFRRPRVAFFSTGDELRAVGEPLAAGQIYDSNRYSIHGMLTRLGLTPLDLGTIPDRRDRIREAFETAAREADAVITSGGVSVGEADYVKETLDELGEVAFWKIAMKPGKPFACGRVRGAVFFGLPGNPVSVMATFYQFVQPALRRMMGESDLRTVTVKVLCASTLRKQPGRMEFQRGILTTDANGAMTVDTTGLQGSHVLSSMSRANCFILLPAEAGDIAAGEWVDVQPFDGLV